MFWYCQSGKDFSIPSRLEWVAFLVPASKSIPHTQAAVTFSRHCGGRKRGRGPLKEWLKVGDKNKLGEGRKLIIHNRQFTWMNTTETEKLRLLPSKKKKKGIFWLRKFLLSHHSGYIYLATTEVRNATRTLFKKVELSNKTNRAFISNSTCWCSLRASSQIQAISWDQNKTAHPPNKCEDTQIARPAFKIHFWLALMRVLVLAHLQTHLLIWFIMHLHFTLQHHPLTLHPSFLFGPNGGHSYLSSQWSQARQVLASEFISYYGLSTGEVLALRGLCVCVCVCRWMSV